MLYREVTKTEFYKSDYNKISGKEFEMTNGAAAGAAAAIAQAIKASGAIVRVESTDFLTILEKVENPLVVHSESRFFSTKYHYLTSYKGLIFYTKSVTPLMLRPSMEIIRAKRIYVPE